MDTLWMCETKECEKWWNIVFIFVSSLYIIWMKYKNLLNISCWNEEIQPRKMLNPSFPLHNSQAAPLYGGREDG